MNVHANENNIILVDENVTSLLSLDLINLYKNNTVMSDIVGESEALYLYVLFFIIIYVIHYLI